MILCKRPLTIYDVDLLGASGLVVLGLAAWWAVALPWQRTARGYHELAARRAALQNGLHAETDQLERSQQQLAQLTEIVRVQTADAPRPNSLSRQLARMAELAKEVNVELLRVVPQPVAGEGAYTVCDIQVTGRGRSHDFIRFLDRLARENPCQTLRACAITRATDDAAATCDLRWTVRFYFLPETVAPPGEAT